MSNSGFYKSVLIEEHKYCHGFNFFFLDGYIIPQLELYCLHNVAAFLLDIVSKKTKNTVNIFPYKLFMNSVFKKKPEW